MHLKYWWIVIKTWFLHLLIEFLKTGKIGNIAINSSISEVKGIIGETDKIANIQPGVIILKYDNLQLTVRDNHIKMIEIPILSLPDEAHPKFPNNLVNEPWPLTRLMSIKELIDIFYSCEVLWEIDSKFSVGTDLCFIIEHKVQIFFDLMTYELSSVCVR